MTLAPNGWTGAQYSVVRVALAITLCAGFVALLVSPTDVSFAASATSGLIGDGQAIALPNVLALLDSAWCTRLALVLGCGASVLLGVGLFDRPVALLLWYLLIGCLGQDVAHVSPATPYLGWLLLVHVLTPRAPFGSWAARGRADPGGGWAFPPLLFAAVWVGLALLYGASGFTRLRAPLWADGRALGHFLGGSLARDWWLQRSLLSLPSVFLELATWAVLALQLAFPVLAIFRRTRPIGWLVVTLALLTALLFERTIDVTIGLLIIHAVALDPAWLAPRRVAGKERLFYDGSCGLCHRTVRLALAEAPGDAGLVFSPLDSDAFRRSIPDATQIPDSLVFVTASGDVLLRTSAVIRVMERLGGGWRLLGWVFRVVPSAIRDVGYDAVARIRHRLFRKPDAACPLIPASLRARFEF